MEAVECGAAALGIILGYHEKFVPLETLRTECGISRDGSKASYLVRAAKAYGLTAGGYRKSIEDLKQSQGPYIVFWNFNHFLVVEGFRKNRVYLNDPATGRRSVTLDEFSEAFTGVVLTMTPGDQFEKGGKPRRLTSLIRKYIKPVKASFPYLLTLVFFALLIGLVTPIFSKIFVDNILVQRLDDWLTPLLLAMLLALVLVAVINFMQNRILARVRRKLSITLSYAFMQQVMRMPIPFYLQRGKAEIASRFELCQHAAEFLSGPLLQLVFACMNLLLFGAILFIYSPTLMGIVVAISLVNLLILRVFRDSNQDLNRRYQKDKFQLMGTAMNGLMMIETLKSTARESDFFEKWAGYEAKVLNGEQKLGRNRAFMNASTLLLSSLNVATILMLGGFAVMQGEMTIGMLVAFVAFTYQFTVDAEKVVSVGTDVQYLHGILGSLEDLFNHHKDDDWIDADKYSEQALQRLNGRIEIRNLSFGYNVQEAPLIEDFNLSLAPGRRVALVGGSGSGKSTIAKIIAGLYKPWNGEILFDNQPVSSIPRHVLKHSLGMVDQEIFLFEGKVKNVLTLWDDGVEESSIIKACKDASIHDDISGRPGGYESTISEDGGNFSGGQRQRLEIARALVNSPSIVVMDEATSALDTMTEKAVNDAIFERGCTCIIVAHRLSSIRDCDEIIVLDKGKVVERGTHEELVEMNGSYVELIKHTS
jgi:NHLM bacteriocin system ABC transporter peptidase/ATP-binding protein